jgi:hypothetical protein
MKIQHVILTTIAFGLFLLVGTVSEKGIAPQQQAPKGKAIIPALELEILQLKGRMVARFKNNTKKRLAILLGQYKLALKPGKTGTLPLLKVETLKIYESIQNEKKFNLKHAVRIAPQVGKAQFLAPRM